MLAPETRTVVLRMAKNSFTNRVRRTLLNVN